MYTEDAMDAAFRDFLSAELQQIRDQGLWKEEWPIQGPQGPEIRVQGREGTVLNFCANNYLGLSSHPELLKAAHRALDEWGYGMSSVRFICGTQELHLELERKVAAFLGMEDALLYAACFDANGGVFEPLLGAEDAILTDQLNHASIIDGVRLCKAKRLVYRHADMGDLETKLKEAAPARSRLIVTDGVFSMDGDVAPLPRICDLAERHRAMVLVDDSHATGFLGKTGRGSGEHCGVLGRIDILTTTFGKELRDRLEANTRTFRERMSSAGFEIKPGGHPIVPILFSRFTPDDAPLAQRFARALLEEGIYVKGFFFPVVPRGQSRIRVQLSAAHRPEHIDRAVEAFTKVGRALGVLTA